jgi:ABC-type phosphate/phosphonate transport system permease subunit
VPGCRVGDWILDRARACVLMAGGAALTAAVASCTRVLIRGLLPVVLALLCSHAMRCFQRRSRLADVVGALVDLEVVSGVSTLVGIVVNVLIALLMTLLIALVIR